MSEKITPLRLWAEVQKVAEERPDFNYGEQGNPNWGEDGDRTCGYVGWETGSTEGEGCIVGQALQRLGVPKDALYRMERRVGGVQASDLFHYPAVREFLHEWIVAPDATPDEDADREAMKSLNATQMAQDSGLPWRLAIQRGREESVG